MDLKYLEGQILVRQFGDNFVVKGASLLLVLSYGSKENGIKPSNFILP